MDILKVGAAFLAAYTAYAIFIGEIKGRSGIHWKTYRREEEPGKFWGMAIAYLALGIFAFIVLPILKTNVN